MKDRIITESHFNYANKFVKILGFNDLADYGRQVGYTVLKEFQDDICTALNKTLDVFKALFPQDGFNLRKIHYKFENIDQVLGFFKKVMTYLSIPFEMIRVRGAFYLRLIPQKTSLYNEYIYRMQEKREMPLKLISEPVANFIIKEQNNNLINEEINNSVLEDGAIVGHFEDAEPIEKYQIRSNLPSSNIVVTPWGGESNSVSQTILNDEKVEPKQKYEIRSTLPSSNIVVTPWGGESNSVSQTIPNDERAEPTQKYQIRATLPSSNIVVTPWGGENDSVSQKEDISYTPVFSNKGPHLSLPLNEEVTFGPEARLPMCNPAYAHILDEIEDGFIPKSNSLNDCIKFSAILEKENLPVARNYLTGPEVNLSNFKDFGYITSIEVFGIEGGKKIPLQQGTEIIAHVSIQLLQKQIVSNSVESGYIFNLDFPNSYFYIYHDLKLQIKNTRYSLFQINIKGKKFLKKYPTNQFIITDHDPKYYNKSKGYEWRIAHGMCGCSIWEGTQLDNINHESVLKSYFTNNQVTQLKEIYPYPTPTEFNGLEIANTEHLESGYNLGLSLLISYPDFYKSHCAFVLINELKKLNFSFIETNESSSIHSLYYPINHFYDAIAKIEIPNNFKLDYEVKLSLFDGVDLIPVGVFDQLNRSIRLEQSYYLLTRGSRNVFLIIQVPNTELYQWLQVNIIFGAVLLNSLERRHVAQNSGFVN